MTDAQWLELGKAPVSEYVPGERIISSELTCLFRLTGPAEHAGAGSCLLVSEAPDEEICTARRGRFLEAMFLRHPNLVRVFDAGCFQFAGRQLHFAVTEPIETTLEQSGKSLEPQAWLPSVSAALEYLHGNQLVYCVLNPGSVWLAGGEWKLGNYSELRAEGKYEPQETRRLMIQPQLAIPPEAWEGIVSPAWDSWSLGMMLDVRGSAQQERVAALLEPSPGQRLSVAQFNKGVPNHAPEAPPHALPMASEPQPPRQSEIQAPLPNPVRFSPHAERVHANAARLRSSPRRFLLWTSCVLAAAALLLVLTLWGQRTQGHRKPISKHTAAVGVTPPLPAAGQPAAAPVSDVRPVAARQEVEQLLNRWVNTARTRDVEGQVSCYAPRVARFFGRHNLSAGELRRMKQDAFNKVGDVGTFAISDLVFDRMGEQAAVVSFRKSWNFPKHHFSGSERDRMELMRIDGEWKIVSEAENQHRSTPLGG